MDKSVWIDSNGNEYEEEEEVVSENYSPFKDEEVSAAIVRDAFFKKTLGSIENKIRNAYNVGRNDGVRAKKKAEEEAFNRGRESVYNGEEYLQMVAETAKAEYDKGYKQGYADATKTGFHIGDEVIGRWGDEIVVTDIGRTKLGGISADGYVEEDIDKCVKTGKTYPWIAEIIKELSE